MPSKPLSENNSSQTINSPKPSSSQKIPGSTYFFNQESANEEIPKQEIQEEEEDDSPDFDNMDEDEKKYYRITYSQNFEILRKEYSWITLNIPKLDNFSLHLIHKIYCDIIDQINLGQTAAKLKVGLILFFAAVELFGRYYKIKAFKGFLSVQSKRIDRFTPYLINAAGFFYSKKIKKLPKWLMFIISIASSMICFLTAQGIASGKLSDKLMGEFDKFIAPDGGRVKYKDDKIPDIPVKPTGFASPDEIPKWAPGLLDSLTEAAGLGVDKEDEKKAKSEDNKPKASKPKVDPAENFDDIY